MDADGRKEGFEFVDRERVSADLEIDGGGGATGLIGPGDIDGGSADGDDGLLDLPGKGLDVLCDRHLQR